MSFHRRLFAYACALSLFSSLHTARAENISTPLSGFSTLRKALALKKKKTTTRTILGLPPCEEAEVWARPIALGAYYFDNGRCAPGDSGAISSFKQQMGRTPAVWMIYQSWTGWNQFPVIQAQRAAALKSTLMVTWEPWNGRRYDPVWNCQNIVAGRYDNYIRSYARAVKSSGVPVLIRLAHEMNGDWYPWGTAYCGYTQRNNANSPAMFVAMWRHVVTLFKAEGADNAKWVWSPNILYTNGFNEQRQQERDLFSLYPGDKWVDWTGASVYNDGARRPWRSFSDLFDSTYRVLTLLSNKPIMIAEMGVTEQGAPQGQTKATWLQQALMNDIPQRYNRVRMVTYFSRDKSGMGESNYSLASSSSSLAVFRKVVNSSLYGGVLDYKTPPR